MKSNTENSESLTNAGMGMGRRRFLATAAGAGTVAAVGSTAPPLSPVGRAQAAVPLVPIGIAAGGAALGYLLNEGIDYILGDTRDYSGYTGADALESEIREGMLNMASADETALTSMQNNAEYSSNIALSKGKIAIIESMNAGDSESAAQTAMENAIDGYFATIQKNVIEHHNSQIKQFLHYMESVFNHSDLVESETFHAVRWDTDTEAIYQPNGDRQTAIESAFEPGSEVLSNPYSFEFELFGGTTKPVEFSVIDQNPNSTTYDYRSVSSLYFYQNNQSAMSDASDKSLSFDYHHTLGLNDPETGKYGQSSYELTLPHMPGADPYGAALSKLDTTRDEVYADLSGFVTDVYSAYEAGEIDLSDVVDPVTAATELEQDETGHFSFQGASAAMLGIPTNKDASLVLEISTEDGPVQVSADIYTKHVPTDADGNEVGFQTGESYSPSTWDAPLFIAYETAADEETGETSSDFVQLEQDFKVLEAFDAEGNDVESFKTTSRNQQTADVSALEEELRQIREQQLAMQEQAEAGAGGGGGGLFGNPASLLGLGAIGALVLAVLSGNN